MSIAPDEEDLFKAELYARAQVMRALMAHYSPYQREQLLNYLGIEVNDSQPPCLPDKDAPNYI